MIRDLIINCGRTSLLVSLVFILMTLWQRLWRWWGHLLPGLLLLVAIGSGVGSHLAAWLSLHNFVIAITKSLVTKQDHVGLLVRRSLGRHTCNGWVLVSCNTRGRCLLYFGMPHQLLTLWNHSLLYYVPHLFCLYHIQNYWHYWKVPSMKEVPC